jgi:hypothetical protein
VTQLLAYDMQIGCDSEGIVKYLSALEDLSTTAGNGVDTSELQMKVVTERSMDRFTYRRLIQRS